MHPSRSSPWLSIPASDYEAHMGSPSVGQLQFLSRVLAELLREYQPTSLAVLGCATGNGFEHIVPAITRQVIGIDINPSYLEILRGRHGERLPGLHLMCADIAECEIEAQSLDLIYGGLIFEYVDPGSVLQKAARWLRPGGILAVVLQLPSPVSGTVTRTQFEKLRSLEPIMTLVSPEHLRSVCHENHFCDLRSHTEVLSTGKEFFVGRFEQAGVEAEYRSSTDGKG